ncbi:MAG TPA: colicin transporter [Mizugakiibacter sp.]
MDVSALAGFHFLRPGWLPALLLVPPLLVLLARAARSEGALARLADPLLLPTLLVRAGGRRSALALAAAVGTLAVLALAGPAWERVPAPLYRNQAVRVIALSLAPDMLAQDVKPDRLTLARYKVRDLLEASRDGRSALIAYAGDAFLVAPVTRDVDTLIEQIDALAPDVMPVQGDAPARAIDLGAQLIRRAGATGGELVLVTGNADAAAEAAARRARAAGVRVSVLGVGTPQGAPVALPEGGFLEDAHGAVSIARRDDRALAALAAAGGGRYVAMHADADDVAALTAPTREQAATASDARAAQWRDRGPWLLLPLLPLAALGFRRGWALLLALALLPPPQARAASFADLWRTPDQQAARLLREGDARAALARARDPALAAAAAYRAGDYTRAAALYRDLPGADARYNLGNALARSGRYREALGAYADALHMNPRMADARANRDAVAAWLKRHPLPPQAGEGAGTPQAGGASPPSSAQPPRPGTSAPPRPGQGNASAPDASPDAAASTASTAPQAGGKPGPADNDGAPRPDPRQQAEAQRAGAALKQAMDRALAGARPAHDGTHRLGADVDAREARLPAAMREALARVPDDPGGLLRRKFLLEWQRRQGTAADAEQP